MRRPSTLISSCSGSARVPSVVTVLPLTATRPCVISSSASRRDATPAAEMIFCSRSPLSFIQQPCPEVYQPPDRGGRRGAVDLGVRDERRQQDVHFGAPIAQVAREQRRFDRGDDV